MEQDECIEGQKVIIDNLDDDPERGELSVSRSFYVGTESAVIGSTATIKEVTTSGFPTIHIVLDNAEQVYDKECWRSGIWVMPHNLTPVESTEHVGQQKT